MKLRFRNNSLRLRVNRREAESLAAGSGLEETVHFPGGATVSYVVEPVANDPDASFHDSVIRIRAPQDQLKMWANSDAVGMYFEFPANGFLLKVALEKDLECLDGPEDERDPNAYSRSGNAFC